MLKLFKIAYKKLAFIVGFCLIVSVSILLYFYYPRMKTDPSGISFLKNPGKIIIDTDASRDDAGAILLALAAEKQMIKSGFEVIAITCVYGNTNLTNVVQNVRKILTIAKRSNIPVYVGTKKPFIQKSKTGNVYENDDLGEFQIEEEITSEVDESKHASVALIDMAREHAGNISVIALGPLTNIALAITLDPSFVYNVKQFYLTGSSVCEVGVEFNFHQDPYANFIVFNGTRGLPAVLLPWETIRNANISRKWRNDVLGAIDSSTIKFLNKIEAGNRDDVIWKVADIIIVALALWPELITRTLLTHVEPVYDGSFRGSVSIDFTNGTEKPRNVIILEAFDVEGFKRILLNAFL